MSKDLGKSTSYAYYVAEGGTKTPQEYGEMLVNIDTVATRAEDAADSAAESATGALNSKNAAQTAATTATNKATEATTAATTATTKAGEASTSASTATSAKDTAVSASQTATTKATEATTAAATATSAKTDAVAANTAAQSAKTAAQTAQTGAETAAASVSASAAQIATNAEDISQLKSEFTALESDGVVPSADQILSDKGVTDSVPYHYRKTGGDGADRLYDQIVGGTVCFNQLCNDASVIVQSGSKYLSKIGTAWAVGTSTGTAITGLTSGVDMIIDLTTMFGSTIADHIYQLEQTHTGDGVAFFKSLFPNDYYPYNAGELVSVSGLSEHKMVGFNQWDEEWKVGTYSASTSTVEEYADNTHIMSKNPIRVIAGATYYINSAGRNVHLIVADANGNVLWRSTYLNNGTFNVPQNGAYVYFNTAAAYGTTYNHDICINRSDPTKNGTYEPYKAHSYPLDSTLTLRGIPKLVDGKIKWDGDVYDADGTVTRKYGIVNLGTLSWSKNTSSNYFYVSTDVFPSDNKPKANTDSINSAGLPSAQSVSGDKLYVGYAGTVYAFYSAAETSAEFKTAVTGKHLVYELATPTTEEADPYQHLQRCDPNGTEEYVSTGIVPVGHNSFYPENLRAKVEQLPWNFASLIAPTESTFTATQNYTTGALFIVQNVLYKATSNIANGGTITPNTNCTATTLAEIISALA